MPIDKLHLTCECDFNKDFENRIRNHDDLTVYSSPLEKKKKGNLYPFISIHPNNKRKYNILIPLNSNMKIFICNPNRIGLVEIYSLINNIFNFESLNDFKITRMDFNADIMIPVKNIKKSLFIGRKRHLYNFNNREDRVFNLRDNNNFYVGKRPEMLAVYDKNKEIYANWEKYEGNYYFNKLNSTNTKNEVTRIEFRRWSNKLPIKYLSELYKIREYNPWEKLVFYDIKNKLFPRCLELKKNINTYGLLQALRTMARKYSPSSYWKYLIVNEEKRNIIIKSYELFINHFLDGYQIPEIEIMGNVICNT